MGSNTAQAALICDSCEYAGAPATYLGTLNPMTNDQSTFAHTSVPTGTTIDDFWVFDIAPTGNGSASANFTVAAPFTGFTGALYFAAQAPRAGLLVGSAVRLRWGPGPGGGDASADPQVVSTNLLNLAAGKYIFRLQGTAGTPFGTYTGQVATNAVVVPEPAMLTLLGLGLGRRGPPSPQRLKAPSKTCSGTVADSAPFPPLCV
jgi:hypothetical protein